MARSPSRTTAPRPGLAAVLGCALALAAATGCDDDDGGGSAAGLKEHLPAAEDLGLDTEREFEWANATDYAVQGPFYSEGTKPSEWVEAIEDAGFEAAAGASLVDSKAGSILWLGAAEFDSEEGATEARDRLHEEDQRQPCFATCAVTPEEYEVAGIPDSVAIHQTPNPGKPPKGLHKFERYLLEFTIGANMYFVQADGAPNAISPEEFEGWATAVYERAIANE